MRARLIAVMWVIVTALAASATPAAAQCAPEWLQGEGLPGVDAPVHATVAWDPDGAGPQPPVLVAGGSFTIAGNVIANYIALWNGSTWAPLGSGLDRPVYALAVLPSGDLVAGGNFTSAGGASANYIARWNGLTWAPLGSGMNAWVRALAILSTGDLGAGGNFTTADGRVSAYWARSGCRCYPNCDNSTSPPTLNVLDFMCFLNTFAAGDPYANCDGSTSPPILNVFDFVCFLNKFAAGDLYANCDGSFWPPVLNVLDFACFINRFAAGCP